MWFTRVQVSFIRKYHGCGQGGSVTRLGVTLINMFILAYINESDKAGWLTDQVSAVIK